MSQRRQTRIIKVELDKKEVSAESQLHKRQKKSKGIETWNLYELIGQNVTRINSLPSISDFKQFIANKCIRDQEVLMFYDDHFLCGASRMCWLFNVWGKTARLINGHSDDLQREGFMFENTDQHLFYEKGSYPFFTSPLRLSFDSRPFLSLKRLQVLLDCKDKHPRSSIIIDTRSSDAFNRQVENPEGTIKSFAT